MVLRTVPLALLLIFYIVQGDFHFLFPLDVGLNDEDPYMPNERESIDDCHMQYRRYGREKLEYQDPLPPYDEPREFSHIAAIGWTRAGGTIDWACKGMLIWENFVLTTAFCTSDARNTAPDVIRMGAGVHFAASSGTVQDRRIKDVIRHPDFSARSGGHDIALLQLDERISINPSAAPACLWLWDEIPFQTMDALGRTADSSKRWVVAKEQLEVKDKDSCFQFAPREDGLPESQICMGTVESSSEECVDSTRGDPVQIPLLHNFKTSPFVVGLLSSPVVPEACNPTRAYTKISFYRDWLLEVMQERNATVKPTDFLPVVCAHRFGQLRARVEELLMERNGDIPRLVAQLKYRASEYLRYIVRIGWPTEAGNATRNDCGGTFVDQQTVLTLAECVQPNPEGFRPTMVFHDSGFAKNNYTIKNITVHPGFVKGSFKNNIAVLKLEKRQNVVPACLWLEQSIPHPLVDLAGVGEANLNNFLDDIAFDRDQSSPVFVFPAVDHFPWGQCRALLSNLIQRGSNRTLEGMTESEHMCFLTDRWAIPGVCQDLPGAPIQRYIFRAGAYYKYLYGLTMFGRTCGNGLPSVAVRIAPHAAWLRSVILDKPSLSRRNSSSESIIVINPDLKRSDECSNGDGSMGICVPHELCRSTKELLRTGTVVTVCSEGSIVCCPWGDIERSSGVKPAPSQLETCGERYRKFRKERFDSLRGNDTKAGNLPHVAEIGWPQNNGQIEFVCLGYLITTNTIVTSAACAESYQNKPSLVRIGFLGASDSTDYLLQPIRRVQVHEDYDDVTGVNNVALITLTNHIEPTQFHFPGCVYRNSTHLPVNQYIVNVARGETSLKKISPLYRSECKERINDPLDPGQFCLFREQEEMQLRYERRCYKTGDLIVWDMLTSEEDLLDPEYLVGLFSHGECELNDVLIATRISAYYDWIQSRIK